MKGGKRKPSELERKLYRSFLVLSVIVILASLGGTLYFDILRQRRDVDSLISDLSAHIAEDAQVVQMLQSGYPSDEVKESLDTLYATVPNLGVALVCNRDGVRFYHTDRQKTGESYVDGEEKAILQGSEPYITTGYGTKDLQRRAFHAVRDESGDIIGFVMVSVFTGVISDQVQSIVLVYLMILGGMLIVSFFISSATMRTLRKTLMGFRPEELLRRYLRQDVVLSAVSEGLVASDPEGKVLFTNAAARSLFESDSTPEGCPITELLPDTHQQTVLQTGLPEERCSWVVNGHSVLASEVPLRKDEQSPAEGVLTVLYDRTEMLHMTDELFGARSMIDALRSFNHEFSNKLHVILGYLETGQTQQAIHYIVNSNLVSAQAICQMANQIWSPDLCALTVGKMMHAAERGIELTLMHDSFCAGPDLLIPAEDMTTLVGNLLENAIEALANSTRQPREIRLGLYCRADCNLIICEDTGDGIPLQIREQIFKKGFSTKGEYRGTGLYAVQSLVRQYGGRIEVETEAGEGSVFTVTFTREETEECIR